VSSPQQSGTGVTSTLLWIDFRAQEIRADLGELRARCSYHDPAPDQAIRDIRIALDELVDRRRALQTEVTTMAFMLFFGCVSATFAEPSLIPHPCAQARQHPRGLGNIPAWSRPSSSGLGGRSPVGMTWSRVCLVELERICVRYMATGKLMPAGTRSMLRVRRLGVTSRVVCP
jgi:hypothetical protein